jgi:UPF0271 protein
MTEIDINADLGEGFDDRAILPSLTSCSIACGAHAGDAETMAATLAAAKKLGVACGAHPSYPDRENFGRLEVPMTLAEISRTILDQLSALNLVARRLDVSLSHVKPHGALYHACTRRSDVARTFAETVARHNNGLRLVGFPGGALLEEGRRAGLTVTAEGFADRLYLPDGTLAPRSLPGSLLDSPGRAADQAVSLVRERRVTASDGTRLQVEVQTICLHGDTPGAARIARAVRKGLEDAGVAIRRLPASG